MGFIFSKSMNENLKTQQEFMVMNSRLQEHDMQPAWSVLLLFEMEVVQFGFPACSATAPHIKQKWHGPGRLQVPLLLERQLLMHNQMRERQMAMQIAWTREFLKYFGAFFGLTAVGLTVGAIKKKKPGLFIPMVPLSFILAYNYDMGYGSLLQRMKSEAENIIDTDCAVLEMPKGPLTFEGLEKARRAQSKFFIEK